MSANRRNRYENTVPVASYAPWLVIAVLLLAGGLFWNYHKIQLVSRGNAIGAKEKELVELVRKNADLKIRIEQLSTIAALQKHCNDGTIKMVKVLPGSVVRLGAGDTRVVSNQGVLR